MAQFDTYRIAGGEGLLLDVQSDLLEGLSTRVVVPLLPLAAIGTPAKRFNPVFEVDGEPLVMATQFIGAVPLSELSRPAGTLARCRAQIVDAIDVLLSGA